MLAVGSPWSLSASRIAAVPFEHRFAILLESFYFRGVRFALRLLFFLLLLRRQLVQLRDLHITNQVYPVSRTNPWSPSHAHRLYCSESHQFPIASR